MPSKASSKQFIVQNRFALMGVADVVFVLTGVLVTTLIRFEFELDLPSWSATAAFFVVAAAFHLAFAMLEGLYAGVSRFGSFDEVAGLARTVFWGTAISAALNRFVLDRLVPVSVSLTYGFVAVVFMGAIRYLWRLRIERSRRPDATTAQRAIVYGAGEGGLRIITSMLRTPNSPYLPVSILDDNANKSNLRLSGIPVEGPLEQLANVASYRSATALIVAIPSAPPEVIRRAADLGADAGLDVMVLPPVDSVLGTSADDVADIRPVTEEDLLGRGFIDTDIDSIASYLTGKRVLVTGAGGSIGSELCRQIHRFEPDELVMLDRDESLLHATQLSIDGKGQLSTRALVVADIRDRARLDEVFEEWHPHVVFHTAALKHVPLLEMYPEEGRKTNVQGTQNLLDAADAHGVERFVNISTDKAADPANVLGYTKREAEVRTARMAAQATGTFMSVRFGNVLGSRGSVLTAFRDQIERGGPITVTHRDVTRYFMTVSEAVQLVIQAGAIGSDGEILILDMGEPVRIADVAERMARAARRPIEIVYTGLRPGEKMHEILLAENEAGAPGPHPLITHVRPALDEEPSR